MNYDQAVSTLMYGNTADLQKSVLEEAVIMGVNGQAFNSLKTYNHSQLVNWWITYFKWSNEKQTWQFKMPQNQP